MIDREHYNKTKQITNNFIRNIAPLTDNLKAIYKQAKIVVVHDKDGKVSTETVLSPDQEDSITATKNVIAEIWASYQRKLNEQVKEGFSDAKSTR